jgi:GNAT superfamily N-acetyltransferase
MQSMSCFCLQFLACKTVWTQGEHEHWHMTSFESIFHIRYAREADLPLLLRFIRELAEYEKLAHEVEAGEEDLRANLFGEGAVAEAAIGEWQGEPVAMATFFHSFSSFTGRRGLHLDDLYVRPEMRGRGVGKAMLAWLARLAVERGCARFEWWVLDWNAPAVEFYRAIGARPVQDVRVQRLQGEALSRLAHGGKD